MDRTEADQIIYDDRLTDMRAGLRRLAIHGVALGIALRGTPDVVTAVTVVLLCQRV